jgi:hypothetical protein
VAVIAAEDHHVIAYLRARSAHECDGYALSLLDVARERADLAHVIGRDAEELVYFYDTAFR